MSHCDTNCYSHLFLALTSAFIAVCLYGITTLKKVPWEVSPNISYNNIKQILNSPLHIRMNGENTRINHGIRQMNKSINTSHRFYLSVFMFIHSSVLPPSNSAFLTICPGHGCLVFLGQKLTRHSQHLFLRICPSKKHIFPSYV